MKTPITVAEVASKINDPCTSDIEAFGWFFLAFTPGAKLNAADKDKEIMLSIIPLAKDTIISRGKNINLREGSKKQQKTRVFTSELGEKYEVVL